MVGSTTILKFTYHDYLDEVFQRQMYESALRDGLTKVFNKKYFTDYLEKEFAFAARHEGAAGADLPRHRLTSRRSTTRTGTRPATSCWRSCRR